ncbi:MAG TPA: DUF1573 domain-containing protein [Terrimicrobiaceae bacterium]
MYLKIKNLFHALPGLIFAGMVLMATGPALAGLTWESPVQDFQRASDDRAVEARYAFKNTGSAPVSIVRIASSCGCTVAAADKKIYLPGESGEITARFTFGNRKGLQRKVITVGLSDGTETLLGLNVSIIEPLNIKPSLLVWRVGEGASPKTVQLKTGDGAPVKIRSVSSLSPKVKARLQASTEPAGYILTVTPEDTAEKLSTTVTIETDYPPDAPKSYPVYVRVK